MRTQDVGDSPAENKLLPFSYHYVSLKLDGSKGASFWLTLEAICIYRSIHSPGVCTYIYICGINVQ